HVARGASQLELADPAPLGGGGDARAAAWWFHLRLAASDECQRCDVARLGELAAHPALAGESHGEGRGAEGRGSERVPGVETHLVAMDRDVRERSALYVEAGNDQRPGPG